MISCRADLFKQLNNCRLKRGDHVKFNDAGLKFYNPNATSMAHDILVSRRGKIQEVVKDKAIVLWDNLAEQPGLANFYPCEYLELV